MPTSRYRRGMKTGVAHKSYGVALPMNHGKLISCFDCFRYGVKD